MKRLVYNSGVCVYGAAAGFITSLRNSQRGYPAHAEVKRQWKD